MTTACALCLCVFVHSGASDSSSGIAHERSGTPDCASVLLSCGSYACHCQVHGAAAGQPAAQGWPGGTHAGGSSGDAGAQTGEPRHTGGAAAKGAWVFGLGVTFGGMWELSASLCVFATAPSRRLVRYAGGSAIQGGWAMLLGPGFGSCRVQLLVFGTVPCTCLMRHAGGPAAKGACGC